MTPCFPTCTQHSVSLFIPVSSHRLDDKGSYALLVAYVDDILYVSSSFSLGNRIEADLKKSLDLTISTKVTQFLGLNVSRTSSAIHLTASKYAESLAKRFNISTDFVATPYRSTLTGHVPNSKNLSTAGLQLYQQQLGCLLFATVTCHPDLAYVASHLAQFLRCSKEEHSLDLHRALRYFVSTPTLGLIFNAGKLTDKMYLSGYVDADHAGDTSDRRSRTGYIFCLEPIGPISWNSSKQELVSLSSAEAEFIAASAATREGLYLQELLDEAKFVTPNQFTLPCDNQIAITIANKPGFVNRTKHISLRYFFVKDAIDKGRMRLVYCPTSDMAADSHTKKLTRLKFHHYNQLGGISESTGHLRSWPVGPPNCFRCYSVYFTPRGVPLARPLAAPSPPLAAPSPTFQAPRGPLRGPVAAPNGPVADLSVHSRPLRDPVAAPIGPVIASCGPVAAPCGPVAAPSGPSPPFQAPRGPFTAPLPPLSAPLPPPAAPSPPLAASTLPLSALPRPCPGHAPSPVAAHRGHVHRPPLFSCHLGGEFSSDLLAAFYAEHGIHQTFTLPASPQQNGVAERRIGLVMEVARTSMIHAAAPHFLWPFAVRYAAHQLNLWPRVSLPETSPTLLWTGKVGDASRFQVWGARSFVRDTTTDKLSPRAIPCVFLGFVPDAPGWQFYDPASRRVFASQDVTFDESVPFYRLFPYRTAPRPPPPLFLAPGPPQVDPLPAPGPAPSGVSQVDPPALAPLEVTGDSGPAASGAVPGGAELGGAEFGGAERAEPGGAASGGAASRGAEPACAEPGGAESGGESPEGSETAFTRSPWSSRLRPRVPLTSQQLHDWYRRRQRLASAPQGSTAGGSSAGVAATKPMAPKPTHA
ncbi:unnamed protein product [Closterium sp. NIES-53]